VLVLELMRIELASAGGRKPMPEALT
jgi:hypothetical protein